MVRVLSLLFCAYKGCGGCTMVTVSNIESRNLCKDLCDAVYVSLFADNPEMVSEAVLCNKVIFRLLSDVLAYDGIYFSIVRI